MQATNLKQYSNGTVLTNDHTVIVFQVKQLVWRNEALIAFIELFFALTPAAKRVETIEGADRLSVHFHYLHYDFLLNIEWYSESIWIEAYSDQAHQPIDKLYQHISQLTS